MTETQHNAAEVIDAYRRRRDRTVPLLLGAAAVVLLVVGLFLVIVWLTGGGTPLAGLFATDTPTPTGTATPVPATPTRAETPTQTETPTPTGPVTYVVEVGDTLTSISEQFQVELLVLMAANNLTDANAIVVGQTLIIPGADYQTPTPTALPSTLLPGTKIEYIVLPGDTLASIAAKFNSTAEAIARENHITNLNQIGVGQRLIVPVGIVTPTRTPTLTLTPTRTP